MIHICENFRLILNWFVKLVLNYSRGLGDATVFIDLFKIGLFMNLSLLKVIVDLGNDSIGGIPIAIAFATLIPKHAVLCVAKILLILCDQIFNLQELFFNQHLSSSHIIFIFTV